MNYRSFRIRASTANDEDRSIDAMIASETPIPEWDWLRAEVVPRVLLASGAVIPKSKQIPLLDSHNRQSTDTQLGSIRTLTKEEGGVSGKLMFSSTAEKQWTKVREKHVTDVSAGFQVLEEVYIGAGETRTIKGKQFTGPVNVAVKWRIHEGSICPIGADEQAKMRGFRIASGKLVPLSKEEVALASAVEDLKEASAEAQRKKEEFRMNEQLRTLCVERGMDAKLSDVDAQKWLVDNQSKVFAPTGGNRQPDANFGGQLLEAKGVDVEEIARKAADAAVKQVREEMDLREKSQRDQREAFERDCSATLELAYGDADSAPTDVRAKALSCRTLTEAQDVIRQAKAANQVQIGAGFSTGPAQRDKHREMLQSAFLVRSLDLRGYGEADKQYPVAARAKGWEQFRNIRLLDFARECLMADGYSYNELRSLSGEQLAKAAMGWPERMGLRHPADLIGHRGYAYHTTGSLAYITLDAMNKTVSNAYNEAPSTWRGPMRQAASVPDFKNKHVIKFSAAGNLPLWQDTKAPQETAFANEKESYAVEARAETASFSWQLYVNDDQDTLSRVPGLLSAAAARTVNAVAWSQWTSNPALADGQTLFLETPAGNRKRKNLTTGAGAPSVLTLQTLSNLMMQMRGLNTPEGAESPDILNIQPVYIIGPTALRTTILQLVRSSADPAASGNSGVYNPAQGLQPVFEPLLDASSTTAWYLSASPSQVDTVEVSFLQGQETPVVESYVDEATWCRKMTIVQSFAAKAIDHRGIQKHAGA